MLGLGAAFVIAVIVTAYLTFQAFRQLSQTRIGSALPQIPNLDLSASGGEPQLNMDAATPLQDEAGPTPQPWDGAGRVTVLVMGLDYRDWEGEGPSRTDTMILFTMDPTNHTAGILSIPRDLWVNIPGFDYGKINTAYFLGEVYDTPGGGPGLAIETVENLLGIEINYYAQVDFSAFERFIDEIGGVEVEVPYEMSVDPLGPHNTVYLDAGLNTLDGPTALAYARNRDTIGGDFDRAERQQQVVLAIRDRILSLNMLPTLVTRAPVLYNMLASGVHSNLTVGEVVSLAYEAAQVPEENIIRRFIGPEQVTFTYSPEGMDILQPDLEAVLTLRDEVFFNTEPIAPAATAIVGDLVDLMRAENASVSVLNATTTPGLASATSDYLRSEGVNVTIVDNATETAEVTTLIDYSGKPYTVQYLSTLLQIDPANIYSRYDPYSQVDIAILIGADWVDENPLP
jgi:LCP family protein required for cell wall assembly